MALPSMSFSTISLECASTMIASISERRILDRVRMDIFCIVYKVDRFLTMCWLTSSTLFSHPNSANWSTGLSTLPRNNRDFLFLPC